MSAAERFTQLGALEQNWDSYGAPPLDRATILRAEAWLAAACIVPCSGGGVQIEWHRDGVEIEVSFNPDGSTDFLCAAEGVRAGPRRTEGDA